MFVAQTTSSAASVSAWDLNYYFSWFRETWSHESITKHSNNSENQILSCGSMSACPLFLLTFIAYVSNLLGSCLEEMDFLGSESTRSFQFCPNAVTESDHATSIVISAHFTLSVPEEPRSNQHQC